MEYPPNFGKAGNTSRHNDCFLRQRTYLSHSYAVCNGLFNNSFLVILDGFSDIGS